MHWKSDDLALYFVSYLTSHHALLILTTFDCSNPKAWCFPKCDNDL